MALLDCLVLRTEIDIREDVWPYITVQERRKCFLSGLSSGISVKFLTNKVFFSLDYLDFVLDVRLTCPICTSVPGGEILCDRSNQCLYEKLSALMNTTIKGSLSK